jgi:pyruvate formate lyase activating enzyme
MIRDMVAFYKGNTHDIHHFLKVYAYARTIGGLTGLDSETQRTLEIAAIVHDIACPLCREKYGRADGALQEKESEPLVRTFLSSYSLPEELVERVMPLKEMLSVTEGGVTFSGGEPLMQWDFVCECGDLLRERGIHVALETCGDAPTSVFREVLSRMDYVMFDLKIADPAAHLAATGRDNEFIFKNARILQESGKPFIFRTPLIPGYTDGEENLSAIRRFVGDSPWETLPYNELAGAKYPMLNRIYPLDDRKGE